MKKSLGQLLVQSGETFGEGVALVAGGSETSFAKLSAGAERLAAGITAEVAEGQRIGLFLSNQPLFPIALHAIFRCGGSALLLNSANSPRELAEQTADAEVHVVLTTERLRSQLPERITALLLDDFPSSLVVVRGGSRTVVALDDSPPRQPRFADADAEAVVIFTSGMKGRFQGAVLTHRNLIANLNSTVAALRIEPSDRVYSVLPFAHAFGLTVCLNAPLAAGATVIPVDRFSPATALHDLGTLGATVLAGVPAMFIGLLGAAAKKGVPEHSLRVALCGGAPLPREVARRWEEVFGMPLRQGYGLTEAAPVCLFNRLDSPNRIGTLGAPFPEVEISIRDPRGAELPVGEVGQLWVRGENVFPGYLGDAAGAGPFQEGWLLTGDLASYDGEVVHFRGTLKEMFTRNGFNVYPAEIRRVLIEDPRIEDVLVCGRPDPGRENEVVLQVRPAPGADLTEDDVRGVCGARLAVYKQPTRIRIVR